MSTEEMGTSLTASISRWRGGERQGEELKFGCNSYFLSFTSIPIETSASASGNDVSRVEGETGLPIRPSATEFLRAWFAFYRNRSRRKSGDWTG